MPEPIHPTRTREMIAADNARELESWIAERAADLMRDGMTEPEARQKATAEFGDVGAAQRYGEHQDVVTDRRIRIGFWLEELLSDLRIALRTLARTPTVSAVVLLTFALGVGATTAVFSLVHALLLRPLPFGDEQSLVYFHATDNGATGPNPRFSPATLAGLRERTTVFSGIASIASGSFVISEGGDPEQIRGASATGDVFDVLGVRPALGHGFSTADEAGLSVVLGDDLWRRRFHADSSVVGRTIELSGQRPVVIGVMPRGVHVPTYEDAEFWTPHNQPQFNATERTRHVRFARLVGRRKPGVSLPAAQADVDRVMRLLETELPQANRGLGARLTSLRTAMVGNASLRLLVLMGAAGFVLLIACANVAGILLSRALARGHELSVRVALGAGRRRLIRQFLAEGLALAMLGSGLGLMVAQLTIMLLRRITTTALPVGTTFALEARVLLFGIGVAVVGGLASSLVPALAATRVTGMALRRDAGKASLSGGGRGLRLVLVAGQVAVAVVLLVGAALFLRTLHTLSALDVGYSTEHALTFRVHFTRPRTSAEQDVFYETLYAQLRALPGVATVGGGNMPMGGQHTITGLAIEGRPVENGRLPDARYAVASDDYFAALRIPILRGRAFGPADREGAPWVALVSERLTRQLWPNGDPIGARVKPEGDKPWATVVGVVGDVRNGSADEPVPSVYTSQRQDHWPGGGTVVVRATGDLRPLMAEVRRVLRRLDPAMPIVGLRTVEDVRHSTPAITGRRLQMQLILGFAVVALVVSAIGVYGVSAYATEARRREFGIRMALGATPGNVLWLALREGANVAVVGVLVGIPIALLLASRLRVMLYNVTPFDPVTVSAVLGALFVVVLAASFVPARRATLIDPAATMRTD